MRYSILALVPFSSVGASAETAASPCLSVTSHRYWTGPEGNAAFAITGKFQSLSAIADAFRLDSPVGSIRDRQFHLADILVRVDFNGNGQVATWVVSGAEPVINDYVGRLTHGSRDHSVYSDFTVQAFCVTPEFCVDGPVPAP